MSRLQCTPVTAAGQIWTGTDCTSVVQTPQSAAPLPARPQLAAGPPQAASWPPARRRPPFTQTPDPAMENLPAFLQGLHTILVRRARQSGNAYTDDTDADLGNLANPGGEPVSRWTIQRGLKKLKAAGVISTVPVQGRRRIYPISLDLEQTVPPELLGGCSTGATGAPHGCYSPPPAHLKVVFVKRERIQRPPNPPKNLPERKQPESPDAPIDADLNAPEPKRQISHCKLLPARATAPAPAEVLRRTPPQIAPEAVQARVYAMITGIVKATAIDAPRAAAPPAGPAPPPPADAPDKTAQTDEEKLLEGLSPQSRLMLDSLPLGRRNRMIREALSPFDDRSVRYLEKALEMIGRDEPPLPPTATVPEMIDQVLDRPTPFLALDVAQKLTNKFKDPQYSAGFQQIMLAVWRKTIDPNVVKFAYSYVTTRRHGAAYFWTIIKDKTGVIGDDLAELAAGETPRRLAGKSLGRKS